MMGSRASTLLRDEELEEIKKETGCEFGQGVGTRPSASGWPQDQGRLSLRSGDEVPGGWGESWAASSAGASGMMEDLFLSYSYLEQGSASCGAVLPTKGGSHDHP